MHCTYFNTSLTPTLHRTAHAHQARASCQCRPSLSGQLQLRPRAPWLDLAALPFHHFLALPASTHTFSLLVIHTSQITSQPRQISTQTLRFLVNASQSLASLSCNLFIPARVAPNLHRRFPNNHSTNTRRLEADWQFDLNRASHERSLQHLTPGSLPLNYQSPTCRHLLPADLPRSLSRQAQSPQRTDILHRKRSLRLGGLRQYLWRPRPRAPRPAEPSPRQGT